MSSYREEAKVIRRLLPRTRVFLGPEATKQALLQVAAPDVLHIATHGFFLGDSLGLTGTRGRYSLGAPSPDRPPAPPSDPLLRSGLVLAGAQSAAAPRPAARDGVAEEALVTALEIAGMNLWGTELVVLSACETGRGDVPRGQGVYGLRRAFTEAGAETLVTSLWKVDDKTTRELMEDFYRSLLQGKGRAAALQNAMRAMRARHPHPYHWAPFIVVGSGAPLRGLGPLRTAEATAVGERRGE